MGKVTIKQVAERAGVSIATVSRVLNNNLTVDAALAEKVLDAARELDYRTALPVRTGREMGGGLIAFMAPSLQNTYFSTVVLGVIETARKNGQNVIVMSSDSDHRQEVACLRSLVGTPVEGLILSTIDEVNPLEQVPELHRLPVVVAARREIVPNAPHIYADNVSAGYIATKYLLRLRRRRIALFLNFWTNDIHDYDTFLMRHQSVAQGSCTAYDRYTGYARALEEEGLAVDPNLVVYSGFDHESGYESAQALLASPHQFDAVLVSNDRCATGVLRLFHEQRINVPDQISMICFNGGLTASVVSPPLTMVEQDNYELGVRAAGQLNELIHGRPAGDVKIDVNLLIRGSTALQE